MIFNATEIKIPAITQNGKHRHLTMTRRQINENEINEDVSLLDYS